MKEDGRGGKRPDACQAATGTCKPREFVERAEELPPELKANRDRGETAGMQRCHEGIVEVEDANPVSETNGRAVTESEDSVTPPDFDAGRRPHLRRRRAEPVKKPVHSIVGDHRPPVPRSSPGVWGVYARPAVRGRAVQALPREGSGCRDPAYPLTQGVSRAGSPHEEAGCRSCPGRPCPGPVSAPGRHGRLTPDYARSSHVARRGRHGRADRGGDGAWCGVRDRRPLQVRPVEGERARPANDRHDRRRRLALARGVEYDPRAMAGHRSPEFARTYTGA